MHIYLFIFICSYFQFIFSSKIFSSTCFPSTISRGDQLRKPFFHFFGAQSIHSFPKILPFIPPFALFKFKTFWDYPPSIDVLHSFIVVQFCLQNKIIPKALKSPGEKLKSRPFRVILIQILPCLNPSSPGGIVLNFI
jgi:hypothetical protein